MVQFNFHHFIILAMIPLSIVKYVNGYSNRLLQPKIYKPMNLIHKTNRIISSIPTKTISRFQLLNSLQLDNALDSIREKLIIPSENICKMVENSPSYRLTIKEGAALSGLSLYETRQGLMTLSTLTGGDLEVTNQGEIIYSFPRNFRSILNQRSIGQKIKNINTFLFPKFYYLLRISVGLALFASITIAFTAIFVLINSSSNNSDNDRDNNRNSNTRSYSSSSPSFYINISDILDLLRYNNNNRNNQNRFQEISYLESFFSFLFGDGNPNAEFEIFQAQEVAKLIELRHGVVTAEELATVLDCPYDPNQGSDGSQSDTGSGIIVNESWLLPALIRFNGEPIVDADGNIVYKFEDLITDAWMKNYQSSSSSVQTPGSFSRYGEPRINEEIVPFSLARRQQLTMAKALGAFNFLGVFFLKDLLFSPAALIRQQSVPFLATVAQIYPALIFYAISYFAIPSIRYYLNEKNNKKIQLRNERRQKWLTYTMSQESFLKKFNSACKVAVDMAEARKQSRERSSGGGDENGKGVDTIIYSTKEPLMNQ